MTKNAPPDRIKRAAQRRGSRCRRSRRAPGCRKYRGADRGAYAADVFEQLIELARPRLQGGPSPPGSGPSAKDSCGPEGSIIASRTPRWAYAEALRPHGVSKHLALLFATEPLTSLQTMPKSTPERARAHRPDPRRTRGDRAAVLRHAAQTHENLWFAGLPLRSPTTAGSRSSCAAGRQKPNASSMRPGRRAA